MGVHSKSKKSISQTKNLVKIFQGKLLKMRRKGEGKDRALMVCVTLSLRGSCISLLQFSFHIQFQYFQNREEL